MEQEYEKLGAFYLGREVDPASNQATDDVILYDSRDLTTHAVILGMTGSGKTGLGIGLLEEAAMDRIPVIAIDPKGDIGNLLLTFPDLAPGDFRPWINVDAALQKGLDPDAFAAAEAEKWSEGLASWDQDGARIGRLREQVDLAIYTPGSSAGRSVSVLRSFDAPPRELIDDSDAFRERIQSTVTGLLGLLGIDADPIRSREHILLSAILGEAWQAGRNLDLGGLIQAIQQPPFTRLGVMELETVYPSKDRFELAMALNALLASPGFQGWMEGEPLDIASMLYTAEGKPRASIFSIAHLSDAERMFFVTMLLSAITAWMRSQSGTTSLRAVVYMDEIFGFFPPSANPPSKAPMLTLLKQARAFGVGLVLATQNPVDLDYKGLGNTGTWFIGRLQTDRDKARVLEALDGAMAGANPIPRQELDRMLSGLEKRAFLLHNVHSGAPRLFTTRWTMSYLAGPLTLNQLRALNGGSGAAPPTASPASAPPTGATSASGVASTRPILPSEIIQFFVHPTARADAILYHPAVLADMEIRYSSAAYDVEETRQAQLLVPLQEGAVPFAVDRTEVVDLPMNLLEAEPEDGASFATLPAEGSQAKRYDEWGKELVRWVPNALPITLYESKVHKLSSQVNESERDFRARLALAAREARDEQADRLKQKYESRFRTLEERVRRAEQAVEKRSAQSKQALLDTGISVLGSVLAAATGGKGRRRGGVLGAFLGSRGSSSSRTVRSAGRAARSRQDVTHAEETVEAAQEQLAALEQEFEEELKKIEVAADAEAALDQVVIRPRLNAISLRTTALVWTPWGADATGGVVPLWK